MNETGKTPEEPRIGVYICHCGGNISDVVDVERVANEAKKFPGVVISRRDMFMCSDPGQNLILDDICELNLDRVVVASCSPFLHEATFQSVLRRAGMNPYLYEHVNIREHVSWVHHNEGEATDKAMMLVRAGVAKAKRLAPLSQVRVDTQSRVLVVGAGVSGMRAALDLAESGFGIDLVEKESETGGFVRTLGSLFPTGGDGRELVEEYRRRVGSHTGITLHLETEVAGFEGYLGNFTITLKRAGGGTSTTKVGAVVIATGFRPYQPLKGEFGYEKIPQVVTMPDFLSLKDKAGTSGSLRIAGRPVENIGFLHCVGSRQVQGVHDKDKGREGKLHKHCSRVCCTTTLHAIADLKKRFPGINVYDFYQDIRAYGRGHEELYAEVSKLGALFIRYDGAERPKVKKAGKKDDFAMVVTVRDQLTFNEEIEIGLDLLVLSVGTLPSEIGGLIDKLKLAVSDDGFLQEVHPKLRPVEQAKAGLLLAGAAQSPKDINESVASASAAAAKAASLLGRGFVMLDPYVAAIDENKCTGCALCLDECSYEGALRMVGSEGAQRAEVNPVICSGCGCCVAVCEPRAIDINGWTLDQFDAIIDAIVEGEEVKLP